MLRDAWRLQLADARLVRVNAEMRLLQRLECVNLDRNALTGVPLCVCELPRLVTLSLAANRIVQLRPEVGQLSQLRALFLSNNQLTDCPRALWPRLSRLEQLSVAGNRLVELPDSIGSLQKLLRLDVSDNALTRLPRDICALTSLVALFAHGNRLARLPDNVGDMRSLSVLSLHSNELSDLPVSLGKLNALEQLSLQANRLLSVEQLAPLHGTLKLLSLVRAQPDNSLPPVANVNLADATDCALHVFDIAQECAARRPSTFQERAARLSSCLRVVRAARDPTTAGTLAQVTALRKYMRRRSVCIRNVASFDTAALLQFTLHERSLAAMQEQLRAAAQFLQSDVDRRDQLREAVSTTLADALIEQADAQPPVQLLERLGEIERMLREAAIVVADNEVIESSVVRPDAGAVSSLANASRAEQIDYERLFDAVEVWCTDQQSHLHAHAEQTERFVTAFLNSMTRELALPGAAASTRKSSSSSSSAAAAAASSSGAFVRASASSVLVSNVLSGPGGIASNSSGNLDDMSLEQLFDCALMAAEQERVWQERDMPAELRAPFEAVLRGTARDVAVLHVDLDQYDSAVQRARLYKDKWSCGLTRAPPSDEELARALAVQLDLLDARDDANVALRRAVERRKPQAELDALERAARSAKARWLAHEPVVEEALLRLAEAATSLWPEVRTRYPQARLGELLASGDGGMLRTLDHYDDVQEMATAGRHVLLRASFNGRPCVLKRFNVQRGADRTSFFKEVRRLRELEHPHVVRLEHVFVHEQVVPLRATHGYLQMPLYACGDLWHWRALMDRNDEERRTVLRQALLGLAHVHRMGVVHCDVKPENIFVDADGSAKLGDFDVSRDEQTRVTTASTQSRAFTMLYVAPELARDARARPTPACDMYAFGLTVFDLFTADVAAGAADDAQPQVTLKRQVETAPLCELLAVRAAGEQLTMLAVALLSDDAAARPDALQALAHRYFVLAQPSRDPERDIRECATCFARVWLDEGVQCAERHFMCATCTAAWASAFCDQPRDRVHSEGGLRCASHDCKANAAFASGALAHVLGGDLLSRYLETLRAAEEQHLTLQLEAQYQERLAEELERQRATLQASESREDVVRRHRNHIADNILTLRCPRRGCHKAFVNFDACFALKCHDQAGNGCGAHFCAWCLQQAPDWHQNHAHVAQCPYNAVREVFGRRESFDACHRTRRTRLVEAYLRALPLDIARDVFIECQRDWADLSLDIAKP
jgi:serine/threonine protein kinase